MRKEVESSVLVIFTEGKPCSLPSSEILTAPYFAHGNFVESECVSDMNSLMPSLFAENTLRGTVVDAGLHLIGIILLGRCMADIDYKPSFCIILIRTGLLNCFEAA